MDENELVQYIIVNKDLKMSTGKIAAQTAHAATIATVNYINNKDFQKWYLNNQKKITLKAKQGDMLRLEEQGYISVRDNGHTEVPPNSLTVVILKPMPRSEAKHIVKRFQLL